MPRPPKNFEIGAIKIDELVPTGYLPVGPDTAIPTRFHAELTLTQPEATVMIEVAVGSDRRPTVRALKIKGSVTRPVTTSLTRHILVDQLLQAAMRHAVVPSAVREHWLESLPPGTLPADRGEAEPTPVPDLGRRDLAEYRARRAARIYADALAEGSRKPAVAVATVMNRSRGQAARYIRKARELGLLAPLKGTDA